MKYLPMVKKLNVGVGGLYRNCIVFMSLAFMTLNARAEIPVTDDFASGAEDKGGFEVLYWMLEKVVQVVIVGVAAVMVVTIGKNVIQKYNDLGDGKSTWLDVGGTVVGGIALLAVLIVAFNWVGTWTAS